MRVIDKVEIQPSAGKFIGEIFEEVLSFGFCKPAERENEYTVEDDYGNIRTMIARDADELGEKIANGEFEED